MIDNNQKQESGRLIFTCSGAADVGELADRLARQLAKNQKGKLFCLAGIAAKIPAMVDMAKSAKEIIAIDGCPMACSKITLRQAGLTASCYNLKDLGFEKGKTQVNEQAVGEAIKRIGM